MLTVTKPPKAPPQVRFCGGRLRFKNLAVSTLCGVICAVVWMGSLPAWAAQQTPASILFGAQDTSSPHVPTAVGSYTRGCAAGLVELPETGPSWQAMRLSRNRNWGHPVMIDFLVDLSESAQKIGWNGLYIGNISQPRGGPISSGHRSHQIGLDVDIWHLKPQHLRLTQRERETISSVSVRSADQRSVTPYWSDEHHTLLKAAASDPRVDRIFVAAAIKVEMCQGAAPQDTPWLQKIRPLSGHNTHFHVRLKCPESDTQLCQTQRPDVATLSKGGSGCDDTLTWWVTDYLNPPPRAVVRSAAPPPRPRRGVKDYTMAELPQQCQDVLTAR